jgi:cytosine/adenosine deaminase-related metal-dependent hydrolase
MVANTRARTPRAVGAGKSGCKHIGAIAAGKLADIASFTLDEPRFAGPGHEVAAPVIGGARRGRRYSPRCRRARS